MKQYLILALGLVATIATAIEEKPLVAGQPIPEVSLRTADGDIFALKAAVKEQPLIVIFYRGGWCPFCNRHLGQLQEAQPQLMELGYRILAISPDRPEKLASYNIDIEAASGETHHLLPIPAVFIVGQDGVIDFSYANPDYKTRLSSEVLLAAAKAAL
jgi:peroxiredoxin